VGDAECGDEAAAEDRHPSQLLGDVGSSKTQFRYFCQSPVFFFVTFCVFLFSVLAY
jgi:hypothetical protein